MKSVALRLAICTFVASLMGCSGLGLDNFSIESKKIDYKTAAASKAPTLEIPPDLTSPARDDRFAVPDNGGKGTATYSAYAGERSQPSAKQSDILPEVDKAHVERSGNQRWLVVAGTPDKLWGTIKDFWQETGFLINLELPEAGVMETDWAENRAKIGDSLIRNMLGKIIDSIYSTPERDKFRTRLEPGTVPGTTDIFISHRGMYEIYITEKSDQTRWEPRAPDPDLEAEMLRRLMVRFGSDQKRADTEIAEAKTKPVDRAKLSRGNDGAGTLEVQESFDRAWRRVGLSLDRVGFTVEDRDRSKGLYFVRYVDPETDGQKKDDGFLSKLAFWKGSGPAPQSKYRIYVKDGGALTTVQVLSSEGGTDNSETSKKILTLLYDQLK
jgi:outer membrane protein assembly factor BamC